MQESIVKPDDDLTSRIFLLRGRRVMLDSDLAQIYQVTTTRLNEQFRRNRKRFPEDFAFQLTHQEFTNLMSQFAISKRAHGGRRKPPVVFTEHGAIMLASVLNSAVAVNASLHVIRAFVQLRELISHNKELQRKITEVERRLNLHDAALEELFAAIHKLLEPGVEALRPREIGFHVKDAAGKQPVSNVGI